MTYGLFHRPFSEFRAQKTSDALAAVDRIPEAELLNPNRAGRLEKMADACSLDVAELRPTGRTGKHRKERRPVSDYGRAVQVEVDVVEVTIPFVGARDSLPFSPSSCTEIGRTVLAYDGYLTATFDNDEQLDRNVDVVIERISRNLEQLKREMGQFRTELVAALGKAADERATAIKARRELDKTRSFLIN